MSLQEEKEEQKRQISPEAYLAERKSSIRRRSWWAIGIGAALVFGHLLLFAVLLSSPGEYDEILKWKDLFRSIFFILGLFAFVGGVWGLYEARRMKLEDLIPSPEAIEFARQAENSTPYFSYIVVGCLAVVFLTQLSVDAGELAAINQVSLSRRIAGLDKPLFLAGEWWRILTYGVLHGGFLHIYFNSQAFYGFGSLIEFLANRAHLAIVFLLSIVGGGILSVVFMPESNSVGASGGIMGLIGYLAIYGYRRKNQLPPDFLRSMLINIGFVAAFGLVAHQIIDNFAHLGGLLTGAIYGVLQVPRDLQKNPRQVNAITEALGLIAMGVFVFTSILSVLLILQYIKF